MGLFVWIGFATVCANLQVVKTVELFGLTATLGNVMYGTIFFATDVLNEKYGPAEARKAVWLGFSTLLTLTFVMQGVFSNRLPATYHKQRWKRSSDSFRELR